MKRIICLITILCLVLGSFSFCFAVDWSSSDQQNLANAAGRLYYMNQSAAYYLYNIATNTNNLYNKAVDIYNSLNYGSHSISYWVNSISTWMSPIFNAITNVPVDLNTIIGSMGYTSNGTYYPYLRSLYNSLSNPKPGLQALSNSDIYQNSHLSLKWVYSNGSNTGQYAIPIIQPNGLVQDGTTYWSAGSPIGNIAYMLYRNIQNNSNDYVYRWTADLTGYNSQQSLVSFADPDSTVLFTPLSATDGIYKYLNAINTPLARLGYVLASDSRIEAQDASAANEQAVVDNFIDSSGAGSASPSDIGSISDLSSGYKDNFGSDASVSGIFNIFNSNNMGWFSQETANQLDTTANNRRGSSFDTPLLDQQIEDIYDQIGVKHD